MKQNDDDHPKVIAKPPYIYLGALLLGLGLDYIWPTGIGRVGVRLPLGAAFVALGVIITAKAMQRFRTAGTNVETDRPTTGLVTGGPYRFSRNPIYLSLSLIYSGIGIAADSLWAMVLLVPVLVLIRYGVISREEQYLERKFGNEYLGYKSSVRRWL